MKLNRKWVGTVSMNPVVFVSWNSQNLNITGLKRFCSCQLCEIIVRFEREREREREREENEREGKGEKEREELLSRKECGWGGRKLRKEHVHPPTQSPVEE